MEVPGVRYAHRDGRAIAYQTWGSGGLDCLIISEWNGNADAMWEHPVHLRLWRVHGSFARVVRVDRSGVGSSDPAPDGVAGVESWSEDLLAVLDAEGWQRFAVSGARSTFGDSEEVVAAAPRAQLVAVHGLSHRRTARDPEVVAGIADFVTAN